MEKSKRFTKMFVELGNQWRIDGVLQALLEENVYSWSIVGKVISTKCVTQFSKIYTRRQAGFRIFPCCHHALKH